MATRPKRLTAAFVKRITTPGRYGDGWGGYGLSLLVKPAKRGGLSKTWSQRLTIHGQQRQFGLGSYPVVTLGRAREKALTNRRAVEQGRDPKMPPVPTFRQAAEAVIANERMGWKAGSRSEAIWRASLTEYAFPRLGRKPVNRITATDILAVLKPIWNTKRATAKKLRGRIGKAMKWTIANGYRTDNPAGDALTAALPRNGHRTTHQRALPHAEVPAAVAKIRAASRAMPSARLCLEFVILTATRAGEAIGARWDEIDTDRAIWTIPANRTKMGREHRVPLSPHALALLTEARRNAGRSRLIFPGKTGGEMSNTTLSKLTRRLKLAAVPHGFRSSFRSWVAATGIAPREVGEAALAHVVKGVEAAYQRSDMCELRRPVMAAWGDYLAG